MRHGFTLIEMIIYLAVVGMIAVSLVTYGISVSTSRSKAEVVSEVQSGARFALSMLRQKMRAANSINFAGSVLDVNPGKLELSMPSPLPSPVVFDVDPGSGRLRMKAGVNPAEFITSDEVEISDLRFINLTDGTHEHVRILMTLRYKNAGSVEYQYEYSIQSAMGVRL
ncbi:MAG: type II secretion system protein [Patescibacteria group bacterium]